MGITNLTEYAWNTRNRKGLNHCMCLDCPYDTLGPQSGVKMLDHCRRKKHGIPVEYKGPIEKYMASINGKGPKSVIITLGYLCWNTRDISVEGVLALLEEAKRLITLGHKPLIVIVDNGSTDGTTDAIMQALGGELPHNVLIHQLATNKGISHARNAIISTALIQGSKYTLFMDGDIEVVPLSVYTMMRYLECHPTVGVIGAYSSNFSKNREECANNLIEIPESRVHSDIRCAWTQYGLFRSALWTEGLKFDDSGPFGKPGWGFEDDDLHYQIVEAGYENRYFAGMRYLHRAIHSSWALLQKDGTSVEDMFHARKDYLIQKWRKRGVSAGILKLLEGTQLPRFKDDVI